MNKFKLKLTFLSLLLSLGVSIGFAQQYGNNMGRHNGNRGGNASQGGQGNRGYSAPANVNSRRGGRGDVGYNAGATCGTRRGGRGYNNTVTTTDRYYRGNSRGSVRTTRTYQRNLPATCFNGNRRTRYIYSDCGTFYHQVVDRRRTVPGRWVQYGCDRYWEPGYTTWVQISTVPMYW